MAFFQSLCLLDYFGLEPKIQIPRNLMIALVAGVDLNHRPLGYEPKANRNYNNLQDAGGPRKAL